MRKFKKILLGAMSVLTLGLFVAVSAKVTAASTQPYVNADFSKVTTSDGSTDVTKNFKSAESFTIDGGTFSTTASSSNMQVNSTGLKWQNNDCSMTFTTTDAAKLTLGLYIDGTDRSMGVSNNNNLSITGLQKNSTGSDTVTYDTDKTYTYSVTSSTKYVTVTLNNCPASTFTIASEIAGKTVYVQSVKIQPYATVTYHTNGGDAIASTTTLYGETFAPATPTYDGYAFMGWYTDESLETAYNTSAIVSDNIDLYADWVSESSVNKYTVSFYKAAEATTDNLIESVEEVVEGTTVNVSLIDPKPAFGKEFVEWRLISDDSVFDSTTIVNSDLAVYAVYSDISITDPNNLSPDLITYTHNYGYTSSNKVSETTQLTPSNYSALTGTYIDSKRAYANINGEKPSLCFHTGGVYSSENGGANGLEVTFSQNVMLKVYCASTSSEDVADFTVYDVNSKSNYINLEGGIAKSGSQTELKVFVPAGTYQIGSNRAIRIWAIEKVDCNLNTTASVFAEKNASGDTLRFIGTLTGITDLADIDSIELILKKNDVATKKQIFLTTCYTSVVGTSQTCAQADGTYYTIYRITGITGLTGVISKQLKVTFIDGSTTLSDVTGIVLD